MRLNKIIQRDYTSFSLYYQIKLPLDLEISIPSDDPVRLVSAFVEEMDLSELYKTYGRIRKNQATPRQMLKLVIYAAMNRIYSSRDIRKACKRDINFMYLLEGMPAPDHATIARFISLHFSACAKVLLAQMSDLLYLLGEISEKTIFIDGTKIESAANKYTFVWKRAITKNQARLYTKLTSFVAECEELYGIRTVYHDQISIHTLKRLKKQLCRVKVQEGIVFVHGIGRRKTQLQKSLEQLDQYLEKRKEYTKKLYTLGDRNSYSKTDHDATFMRLKRDFMGNDQLLQAYNLQAAICDEYIAVIVVKPYASDIECFVPLMEKFNRTYGHYPKYPVADAGYGSYNNYLYCEEHGMEKYMKFTMYKKETTDKKYHENPYRAVNFAKDADGNLLCPNGRKFLFKRTQHVKYNKYGRTEELYECESCEGCQHKQECCPRAHKNRTIRMNQELTAIHQEVLQNLESIHGALLRMNRSIQSEGTFGVLKWDKAYKRLLRRGEKNVILELTLISCGFNLYKYHNKKQRQTKVA